MPLRILLITILVFTISKLHATDLYGLVSNKKGEPLPFANIYVEGTSIGTTSNEFGEYLIKLDEGFYSLVFDYIGYKQVIKDLLVSSNRQLLNVVLTEDEIVLGEVVITGDEDPAYKIIREAIKKRKYHLNQVENVHTKAYAKGMQRILRAPDKIMGQTINFDGTLDSNNAGIVYLSESISDLYFEKPDKIKEVMVSSKLSGFSQGFSWNRAGDFFEFDFYKNSVEIEGLSDRVFISPIAETAMIFYRYRLEGYFMEGGKLVNKIKVIPRRKNDPVYAGYIYIIEEDWNIHSLDLILTKNNQVNFVDTIWINFTYVPINDSVWMPMSKRFDFTFSILGIDGKGYYLAVFSDYEINLELEKKHFTNEILKIEDDANKRDSTYWKDNRPIPLTEVEEKDYARKDSVEIRKESKSYLDSLDKASNKFSPWDILLGYKYGNSYRKFSAEFMPLPNTIQFNTVEGYNLKFGVDLWKEFEHQKRLRISPLVRYGFSNTHFQALLKNRYFYNSTRFAFIGFDIGQYIYQFNKKEPITEVINSLYTLLGERNYMKLYEDRHVLLKHRIELVNGLRLYTSVAYRQRNILDNTSNQKWVNKDGVEYTSNVPDNINTNNAEDGDIVLSNHDAFIFKVSLNWTPGLKYISRPDWKINIESKWPKFFVNYEKAIPGVINSQTNYDKIQFGLKNEVKMGLFGNSVYRVEFGGFINDNAVPFMDYNHFNGNQTVIGLNYSDGFQLLDYYINSTTSNYVQGHYQHNFDGFIFNKIPIIRKLKLQALAGVHFVYSQDYKDYTEIDIGIENILRVFRIDFVTGISSTGKTKFGVTFGLDFGQLL